MLDKLNIEDLGDLDAQVPTSPSTPRAVSSSTVTAYIRGVGQADPLWGVDPAWIYLDDVYIARPQGALLDVFDAAASKCYAARRARCTAKHDRRAIKYISRGIPTEQEGFAAITVGNYSQLDVKRPTAARSAARTAACAAASRSPASTATASAKTW